MAGILPQAIFNSRSCVIVSNELEDTAHPRKSIQMPDSSSSSSHAVL